MRVTHAQADKKKADWGILLEEAGLGEDRLLRELNARLRAKVIKYYQGVSLGEHVDNRTRMQATELLAELLGRKKAELSVNHSGTVSPGVTVYLPDNGRDGGGEPNA